MFDDISHQIRSSKKTLRKKSKDYILNFKKIEKFIKFAAEDYEINYLKDLEVYFLFLTLLLHHTHQYAGHQKKFVE